MVKLQTHPLPPGTLVAVISTSARYRSFIEGRARIICPFGDEPHVYQVQFENEKLPQIRYVAPQRHPSNTKSAADIHNEAPSTFEATPHRAMTLALLSRRRSGAPANEGSEP